MAPEPIVSKAEVMKIEVTDQSFTTFTSTATLKLDPAQAHPAREARYELFVGDGRKLLAAGKVSLGADVAAGGTVEIAATAPYADEDDLGDVMEREAPLPYVFKGTVTTDDGHIFEFQRAAMVRAPRVPNASVWHVETSIQDKEVSLVFFLRVENMNPFELQLNGLAFDLAINGTKLVEKGTAGRKQRVPPSATANLEIPFTLSKENFPQVEQIIRSRARMQYLIDGQIQLSIGHIPVELAGPIEF
ncbi:hypothetical protein AKJ08_0143 [Vulgatibacter incomptus]|uniref:Water stress and hypersensitive response domain-containing protein n=1 Tax=Vulgatibacter incomptus TaxID=1391653 RepID=A0A0K1P8M3_9BACT|nr:hypothetical protein AKJ08_0143 [Vulgatibacter incomptus]